MGRLTTRGAVAGQFWWAVRSRVSAGAEDVAGKLAVMWWVRASRSWWKMTDFVGAMQRDSAGLVGEVA